MKLVVAGLGYVGSVSAASFAYFGHQVVGVDVSPEKVEAFRQGVPPVREPRLDELVSTGLHAGLLGATTSMREAILDCDVILVCVGTPSDESGGLSLSYVTEVMRQIGDLAREGAIPPERRIAVVVRSTMLPGSSSDTVLPSLVEAAGEGMGQLGYGVMPEFLREGSAVADFFEPAKTVIGATSEWVVERLMALNRPLPGPKFVLGVGEAEMTKYLDNSFHALKVAFANETQRIALSRGLDVDQLFQPFLSDGKLNISTRYLKPGAPFGGSCLPKDVRALVSLARRNGVSAPLMKAVLETNRAHSEAIFQSVASAGAGRVVLLGLAFKSHTDDLRESPFVDLAQQLVHAGREVVCYDATIATSPLFGVNRTIFEGLRPSIKWVVDVPEVVKGDVVVLCTDHPVHVSALNRLPSGHASVVDLTGKHVRGRADAQNASSAALEAR